jgi:hypothetical protein
VEEGEDRSPPGWRVRVCSPGTARLGSPSRELIATVATELDGIV